MLHEPKLLDALEALVLPSGWDGEAWRRTFVDRDPLTPNSRGARWNPPGLDALYGSLTSVGAEAEHSSMLSRQPIPPSKAQHTFQLRVSLSKVADIRGSQELQALGFGSDELTGEDWTPAQRVGAAAAWLGIAALIVPSARHPDGNIVVFVNNLTPNDMVDPLPSFHREDPA